MRTDYISEISASTRMWSPGIFAVEDRTTGRRLYVATTNVSGRYRDHLNWLRNGVHANGELQRDWAARADDFRFILVRRTELKALLNFAKQALLDMERRDHPLGPYNVKNAVPVKRPERPAAGTPLPPGLLNVTPSRRPFEVYKRVLDKLGDDAFDVGFWERKRREAMAEVLGEVETRLGQTQVPAATLFAGLPSRKSDPCGRVDELLARIKRLCQTGQSKGGRHH
jgi:hypothetical protein